MNVIMRSSLSILFLTTLQVSAEIDTPGFGDRLLLKETSTVVWSEAGPHVRGSKVFSSVNKKLDVRYIGQKKDPNGQIYYHVRYRYGKKTVEGFVPARSLEVAPDNPVDNFFIAKTKVSVLGAPPSPGQSQAVIDSVDELVDLNVVDMSRDSTGRSWLLVTYNRGGKQSKGYVPADQVEQQLSDDTRDGQQLTATKMEQLRAEIKPIMDSSTLELQNAPADSIKTSDSKSPTVSTPEPISIPRPKLRPKDLIETTKIADADTTEACGPGTTLTCCAPGAPCSKVKADGDSTSARKIKDATEALTVGISLPRYIAATCSQFISKKGLGPWGKALIGAVDRIAPKCFYDTPKTWGSLCKGYSNLTKPQKQAFIAMAFAILADDEATCWPGARNGRATNGVAIGLFQLEHSAKLRRDAGRDPKWCGLGKKESSTSLRFQTECAVSIVKDTVCAKGKAINFKGGYWAELRKNKQVARRIVAAGKANKLCQ